MFTYFIAASEKQIAGMKTIAGVLSHMVKCEPLLGANISLEALSFLSNVFLGGAPRMPTQTDYALSDGSTFYLLDRELCRKIATAQHEQLLDASVPWDERAWQGTNVNRIDLAGFLLDLSTLCKQTHSQDGTLYVLLSKE